jgi:hypothetical protein
MEPFSELTPRPLLIDEDGVTPAGFQRLVDWFTDNAIPSDEDELHLREVCETFSETPKGSFWPKEFWASMPLLRAVKKAAAENEIEFINTEYSSSFRARLRCDLQPELGVVREAPTQYRVGGFVPEACVTILVGTAGALKTWTALSLAVAVAYGRPWLGKHAVKEGRVAVINAESSKGELTRRLHLLGDDESRVVRISHPQYDLSNERFWTELAKLKSQLVVIDSCNPDGEEGSASVLTRSAQFADKHRTTVIITRHGDTAATHGPMDACYLIEALPNTDDAKRSRISCGKFRCGREPEAFAVQFTDADGVELCEESLVQKGPRDRIKPSRAPSCDASNGRI